MRMLEVARHYYGIGLTPIPVVPETKTPACEWAQFQYRRPSWEELEQVWLKAIERYGDEVGIATILGRAHGLVALDIDDVERFRQARQAVGLTDEDLRTWAQKSARGGALYFRYPTHTDIKRLRNPFWGAELRGEGHIQVLPPSIHPSGKRYEWLQGRSPEECELGELPDIVLEVFVRCDDAEPLTDEASLTDEVGATDWEKPLVNLLSPLWVQGVRHDAALALAGLMAKKGVPKEQAMSVLDAIAEAAGDREWRDRRRACEDTYERAVEGREVVGFTQLANLFGENIAKAIDVLVPNLQPNSPSQPSQSQQNKLSRPIPILTPIAEEDATEFEWVWDGILAQGNLALLGGLPKSGKSYTALNLAAAIADGREFLGRPTKQQRVLVLAFERRKSWAIRAKRLGLTGHPNLLLWKPQQHGPLPTIADLEFLHDVLKVNSVQVVIVDHLGLFLAPLEHHAATNAGYTPIVTELQKLKDVVLEPLDVTFVGICHFNKAEQDQIKRYLGTIGQPGAADVLLGIETEGDCFHLQIIGNDVDRSDFWFVLDDDGRVIPTEKPEEPTKEMIVAQLIRNTLAQRRPMKRKELVDFVRTYFSDVYGQDISVTTVNRALERARKLGVRQIRYGVYGLGEEDDFGEGQASPETLSLSHSLYNDDDEKVRLNFVTLSSQVSHEKVHDKVPNSIGTFSPSHEYIDDKVTKLASSSDPDRCPRCGSPLERLAGQLVCWRCDIEGDNENSPTPDTPQPTSLSVNSSENSDNSVAARPSARSRFKRLVGTERWLISEGLLSPTSDGLISPSVTAARSGTSPPEPLDEADAFPF